MNFTFRPATRQHTPLIIGVAGPTKSGKSMSALRLATGLAGGKTIAMLNTEGPRGHMYADRFQYITADMSAPFRHTRYIDAIQEMKKLDLGCAIIDSVSHSHDGPGGFLEWHEEILDRVAGKDHAKRERATFVAWVEPKAAENQFIYAVQELLCPVILCMRAKEKIKISKGKVEELGWQPIVGERVAFETIFTLMLPPHSKGVPDLSISEMREPFDTMIPPGKQIDEALGQALAAWASGGTVVHHTLKELSALVKAQGLGEDDVKVEQQRRWGVGRFRDLSQAQIDTLYEHFSEPQNESGDAGFSTPLDPDTDIGEEDKPAYATEEQVNRLFALALQIDQQTDRETRGTVESYPTGQLPLQMYEQIENYLRGKMARANEGMR